MGLYILYIGLNMLQVDVLLYQTAVESSKVLRRRCAATASKKGLSSPFAPWRRRRRSSTWLRPRPCRSLAGSLFRGGFRCEEQPPYVVVTRPKIGLSTTTNKFRIDGLFFPSVWKLGNLSCGTLRIYVHC